MLYVEPGFFVLVCPRGTKAAAGGRLNFRFVPFRAFYVDENALHEPFTAFDEMRFAAHVDNRDLDFIFRAAEVLVNHADAIRKHESVFFGQT